MEKQFFPILFGLKKRFKDKKETQHDQAPKLQYRENRFR